MTALTGSDPRPGYLGAAGVLVDAALARAQAHLEETP
jgi:hypothetical protein